MLEELQKFKGHFKIKVFDKDMKLKEVREVTNLIVTAGKNFLTTWLAAATQANAFMPGTAIGTGTNAPTTGDTTLQTELSRVPNTASSSTNVFQTLASFGPGVGTGAITEAGMFSSSVSGGTMFARQVFSVVNKGASDTLQITWQITFS